MTNVRRTRLAVASALVLGAASTVGTAHALPSHTYSVRPETVAVAGRQTPLGAGVGASMAGDLLGSWEVLTAENLPANSNPQAPSAVIQSGAERFLGCLDQNRNRRCDADDPFGSLQLDYHRWIPYDTSQRQLGPGSCVHHITGGTLDFTGARGNLTTHDQARKNRMTLTTYRGHIVLKAVAEDPTNSDPTASSNGGLPILTPGC